MKGSIYKTINDYFELQGIINIEMFSIYLMHGIFLNFFEKWPAISLKGLISVNHKIKKKVISTKVFSGREGTFVCWKSYEIGQFDYGRSSILNVF